MGTAKLFVKVKLKVSFSVLIPSLLRHRVLMEILYPYGDDEGDQPSLGVLQLRK